MNVQVELLNGKVLPILEMDETAYSNMLEDFMAYTEAHSPMVTIKGYVAQFGQTMTFTVNAAAIAFIVLLEEKPSPSKILTGAIGGMKIVQ